MQIQSTAQSKNTQKFCFGFQSKNVYIIYFIYIKQTKGKIINYLRKKRVSSDTHTMQTSPLRYFVP